MQKIGADPENLHIDTPTMTLGVVLLKWIIFEKDNNHISDMKLSE